MHSILASLFVCMPALSMLSGLLAAPFLIGIFCVIFSYNYRRIGLAVLKENYQFLIFASWVLITCFWAPNFEKAIVQYVITTAIYLSSLIIVQNKMLDSLESDFSIYLPLAFGCLIAIIIFAIEYVSEGSISIWFRSIFQSGGKKYFALHFLDRGCSLLAIISWPVMYFYLKRKFFSIAIVYYSLVLYILGISDSFATYLGFIGGTVAFCFTLLVRRVAIYISIYVIIASAVLFPVFSIVQSPLYLSEKYFQIPDSGKHRLFIWKFTAYKALEKPLMGWGFNSSREIPIDEEGDVVYFQQYKWHPLPLHPHNCFMNIWLECGLIGLVLFFAILIKIIQNIGRTYKANHNLLWLSMSIGCFTNYFLIALVSYGMWQTWWVCCGVIACILVHQANKLKKTQDVALDLA